MTEDTLRGRTMDMAERFKAGQAYVDRLPPAMAREGQQILRVWANGLDHDPETWRFPASARRLFRLLRGDT